MVDERLARGLIPMSAAHMSGVNPSQFLTSVFAPLSRMALTPASSFVRMAMKRSGPSGSAGAPGGGPCAMEMVGLPAAQRAR
jgi:hypothetical protein